MEYDRTAMPANYDAGRSYRPVVMAAWLETIARWVPKTIGNLLDLGCGTGRYAGALATRFASPVVAVDPSEKMLAEAARKLAPNVRYVRAMAEALPLADEVFDMVFVSMVFHHFSDSQQAVRECRRVLRPGGVVCLRAGTSDRTENQPYVPFFPSARKILHQFLPSKSSIEVQFTSAGFAVAAHELVSSEAGENWSAYGDKLAHKADSILVQLPDHEFEEGLTALRKHALDAKSVDPVVEPVDFFVFRT
jgi:ubiquinone/menaquinone biosynthesis C-methylase UbiE